MKKRILSLLLAAVMVCALLPTVALAADSDFVIMEGSLAKYNGPGGNVVIPNSVTSIGWGAFSGCTGVTGVTIPSNVTRIGEEAFCDCTGLTSVTIPNGVTFIGAEAFEGCTGLTSMTIPDSVTSIGGRAFWGCAGLTNVNYSGTEAQWKAISIGGSNGPLNIATIHYNVALAPAEPSAPATDAPGQIYADVPDNAWYAEAVNAMSEGGLFTGYPDGLFHPNDPVTFAQVAVVLCRVMGLETANPADAPEGTHWAQTAWDNVEYERPTLCNISEENKYSYYHGPDYTINDNVPRVKVLESLVRLASNMPIYKSKHLSTFAPEYPGHKTAEFQFEQISPKIWTKKDIPDWRRYWAFEYQDSIDKHFNVNGYLVLLAYNIGITNGTDDRGTCSPYENVTRAQLCQFLWNMGITNRNSVVKTQKAINNRANLLPPRLTFDVINGRKYQIAYRLEFPDNFGYTTNLQFYVEYPTYKSAHAEQFVCQSWQTHHTLPTGKSCKLCYGNFDGTDEKKADYELEKQAAYDAHDQWLKEFEGTRQWEIATGKT